MKRALTTTALLAMAILMAGSFAAAQDKTANTVGGQVTIGLLGRSDVTSAKFEEYREVPKGVSIPYLSLFATASKFDFNLQASNVRQTDQRYTGWFNTDFFDFGFDYNQTPHKMGNNAKIVWSETAEGVWGINSSLRSYYASVLDPLASSARTYAFYDALLAPAFADANTIDINSLRQRGSLEFDLSKKLPFDFALTYMREAKTGYRGQGGDDILGWASVIADLPEPLNEITQDFGFRAAYNFKMGNVHGTFNRNTFTNRADTMLVDNPFRPNDLAYVSSSVPSGSMTTLFTAGPDNEATTGAFGFQLKFPWKTRIAGDFAMATWTQNSPFHAMTLNPLILNSTGQPTNLTSSLQQTSLNGKIDTSTINFSASTRPIDGLGIRLHYRSYGYKDKSARYVITGDTSGSPDQRFQAANAPTAEEPYGHATANRTDADTSMLHAQASYDIKALTLEGTYRNASSSWVGRLASSGDSGTEKTYSVAAIYRAGDLFNFRFHNDWANRTVSGVPAGSIGAVQGVMADHAKRDQTRTGFQVEVTPASSLGLSFSYFRRNVEFPDRPAEAANDPNSVSGLLSAKYDSFTGEVDFNPGAKMELSAYYTYEKDASTNQWVSLTSGNVNNKLNYAGLDTTNTFGATFAYHIVPDKWTFTLRARQQKIDGLMDVTALETGSFYNPGRTTLIPAGQGGAKDIDDWDDTTLTTFGMQLDYAIAKSWKVSGGYAYEKYDYGDAYTAGTTLYPINVYFGMKPDNGAYTVNVAYTKLTYRF